MMLVLSRAGTLSSLVRTSSPSCLVVQQQQTSFDDFSQKEFRGSPNIRPTRSRFAGRKSADQQDLRLAQLSVSSLRSRQTRQMPEAGVDSSTVTDRASSSPTSSPDDRSRPLTSFSLRAPARTGVVPTLGEMCGANAFQSEELPPLSYDNLEQTSFMALPPAPAQASEEDEDRSLGDYSESMDAINHVEPQTLMILESHERYDAAYEHLMGKRLATRARLQEKFSESRSKRIEERDFKRALRKEEEQKLKTEGRFVNTKSNQHKGNLLVPEIVSTLPMRYPDHPLMDHLREIARAVAFNPRLSRSTQFKIVDQAARWLDKASKAAPYNPQHQAWVARQKEIREQEGRNN